MVKPCKNVLNNIPMIMLDHNESACNEFYVLNLANVTKLFYVRFYLLISVDIVLTCYCYVSSA